MRWWRLISRRPAVVSFILNLKIPGPVGEAWPVATSTRCLPFSYQSIFTVPLTSALKEIEGVAVGLSWALRPVSICVVVGAGVTGAGPGSGAGVITGAGCT